MPWNRSNLKLHLSCSTFQKEVVWQQKNQSHSPWKAFLRISICILSLIKYNDFTGSTNPWEWYFIDFTLTNADFTHQLGTSRGVWGVNNLRAHRRIFRALLRKWNVISGNWRHHIMSWQENPLTSKSHHTNCCFHRRFFLALPSARSQINCACVNELTSGLRKKLNFRRFSIFT